MYRYPADLDLNDIVGSDLDQICLGGFDVQFVFSSKTRICVQSRVSVFENNDLSVVWDGKKHWSNLSFHRLLNATVQSYKVINDQTLEIQFSGALKLQLHDDSDQYESMQIYRTWDASGPIVI
jgi:hypothetical protein